MIGGRSSAGRVAEMSTPNDLQALLASIRPRPSPSNVPAQDAHTSQDNSHHQPRQSQPYDGQVLPHPQLQQHGYRQPSVSSTIHSPSPANTPPHHGSDVLSPNIPTPRGDIHSHQPQQNPGRAADLLNLLKISQGPATPSNQLPSERVKSPQTLEPGADKPRGAHARNISASDLVSSLFGGQEHTPAAAVPSGSLPGYPESSRTPQSAAPTAPTAENTQEMLLRLLNRQQRPEQPLGEGPPKSTSQMHPSVFPQEAHSGTIASGDPTAFVKSETLDAIDIEKRVSEKSDVLPSQSSRSSSTPKDSIFTYVNPFEQLAAASPRKSPHPKSRGESPAVEAMGQTSVSVAAEGEPLPASKPLEIAQPRRQSPPLSDEQKEAVSEVVDELVDRIGREMGQAPEKSAKGEIPVSDTIKEDAAKARFPPSASPPANVGTEITKDTTNDEKEPSTKGAVKGAAVGVEETRNDNAEQLADSWESAEDSAEKDENRVVPVYNFPLRPFISISVKGNSGKLSSLRDDGAMDIARLKKDFDQLDRSLTSATSDYIVYALAKHGGIRIIRQDDGSDKQVFRFTRDRVFNVALCTSSSTGVVSEEQAVLGIGVSGAVYWAMISRPGKDLFEMDALESESLILPPFPASDENTSGGQLKTRAKQSSRHPAFFAIGRGKNIYVVSPQAAMDPNYGVSGAQRTVNTEKFFKERAMKISTGKAGKDFMFSDDDTVIASLDKTGRLRFWDIREVAHNPDFFTNGPNQPEVRVPLSTFVTGVPTEKSWPTSILFIDKLRAYTKSLALRYVLVGLKQNHTLQLWDIGLGKAVQELKFPHENESDAICSVAYHAASGIIVVAHPTRNSIYFVHLSAPRYNLPPMSQASFVRRSSERDNTLPRPDSTACMSGIREISFASKGQLRSFDLLPVFKAAGDKRGLEDDSSLFELYVMHSKGVTCLNIKKEDLGLSADNKIVRPVNALDEDFIDMADLQSYPTYVAEEPSVNGETTSTQAKTTAKDASKKAPEPSTEPPAVTGASQISLPSKPASKKKSGEDESATTANGSEKAERKKKKKAAVAGEGAVKVKESNTFGTTHDNLPADSTTPTSIKITEDISNEPAKARDVPAPSASTMNPPRAESVAASAETLSRHIEDLQSGVSSEFSKSLRREFEGLYRRFDEERRTWDAAAASKQDQVLRLVSSTLSDNVEKNLARIVSNSIESQVLPAVMNNTSAAVGRQLDTIVSQQIGGIVSRELREVLPQTLSPEMMGIVRSTLASQVENEMSKVLHNTLMPSLKDLTRHSLEKVGSDMEKSMRSQMKHLELQHESDSVKIDQLTALVRGLSDTVSSMAEAQTSFQSEILRLNRVVASRPNEEDRTSTQPQPLDSVSATASESRSAAEAELAEIAQLMSEGKYEAGSVKVSLPSLYQFGSC